MKARHEMTQGSAGDLLQGQQSLAGDLLAAFETPHLKVSAALRDGLGGGQGAAESIRQSGAGYFAAQVGVDGRAAGARFDLDPRVVSITV